MAPVPSRARVAISIATFAAGGCLSPVPLDMTPDVKFDTLLLGEWECQNTMGEKGTETGELTVTPIDELRLLVEVREPKLDPQHYEAYASTVTGFMLFNVKAAKDTLPLEPQEWVFVRATFSGDKLRLQAPGDDQPIKAATPAALRSLLEPELKKPGYFLDVAVCGRKKDQKDGPE
jgi:hypothetical protein